MPFQKLWPWGAVSVMSHWVEPELHRLVSILVLVVHVACSAFGQVPSDFGVGSLFWHFHLPSNFKLPVMSTSGHHMHGTGGCPEGENNKTLQMWPLDVQHFSFGCGHKGHYVRDLVESG